MTPDCSACGYAVEWLRSCYSSRWKLFKNCPEVETPGQFFFCPPGIGCFPGAHNFGSRIWTSDERDPQPGLGEVNVAKQVWSRGVAPDPYPFQQSVGSSLCIAEGEVAECPVTAQTLTVSGCATGQAEKWITFFDCDSHFASIEGLSLVLDYFPNSNPSVWEAPSPLHHDPIVGDCFVQWKCTGFEMVVLLVFNGTPFGTIIRGTIDRLNPPPHEQVFLCESLPGDLPFRFKCRVTKIKPRKPLKVFPDECFLPGKKPQFQTPPSLLALAAIMQKVYANDASAQADLKAFLLPGALSQQWDNTASLIPGMVAAWDTTQTIVVIAGTTNFQQLAVQIAYALGGPVDVGSFSTNPAWLTAALAVSDRLTTVGVDPFLPVTLVGHSYGGALAAVLSAVYKLAIPGRGQYLMTMGMPRPGDGRLATILSTVRSIHLANFEDPVAALPPVGIELIPLIPFVPGPVWNQWNSVVKPSGQVILLRDGTMVESDEPVMLYALLLDCVATIIVNGVLPSFVNHTMDEYEARLALAVN